MVVEMNSTKPSESIFAFLLVETEATVACWSPLGLGIKHKILLCY